MRHELPDLSDELSGLDLGDHRLNARVLQSVEAIRACPTDIRTSSTIRRPSRATTD